MKKLLFLNLNLLSSSSDAIWIILKINISKWNDKKCIKTTKYAVFYVFISKNSFGGFGVFSFFSFESRTSFKHTRANTPISLFVARVIDQRIESLIFVTVIHSSDESNCKSVFVAINVVIKLKITTALKQLNKIKGFILNAFWVWFFLNFIYAFGLFIHWHQRKKRRPLNYLINKTVLSLMGLHVHRRLHSCSFSHPIRCLFSSLCSVFFLVCQKCRNRIRLRNKQVLILAIIDWTPNRINTHSKIGIPWRKIVTTNNELF